MANKYTTDTGRPIGNKTATTLIIRMAKEAMAGYEAEHKKAPTKPAKYVAAALKTFVADVKPSEKRVGTLKAMLEAKGYKL